MTEGAPKWDRERVKRVALLVAKYGSIALGALAVVGAFTIIFMIRHYESELPGVAELKSGYRPPQVTRVLARDGTLIANLFTERRTVIPLAALPDHAKLAFLAAEDASFYEHEGLDYFGMLRAMLANLRAGKTVQGGSTITQQVVKNVLLVPERSYERKIKETILARRLEQSLSKDEIFGLYLNHIYLGHGRYGIEEASRYYFGKPARELKLGEATLLAGLVAAPERFSPRNAPDRALLRRRYVLSQMLAKGFVTRELHDAAEREPLRLAPAVEEDSELCPEVVDYVKKMLSAVAGEQARRGGFIVHTTIDPALQAAARRAVRQNLERYAERQKVVAPYTLQKRKLWGALFEGLPRPHKIYVGEVVSVDDAAGTIDVRVGSIVGRVVLAHEERHNPKRLSAGAFTQPGAALRVRLAADPEPGALAPLRLELGPQSALVAVEPRSREVRALVGSHEALAGGLDRATRARRQPGSAFKPFVYSYALSSRRFTAASVLELDDPEAGRGAKRRVSVRQGLAKSDNAAALHLFQESGPGNVVQWSHSVGIESRLEPTPSLALGAYEVTPLELTNAYATFASGGEYAPAVIVTRIVGPGGASVPLPPLPPRRRALSEAEAYLITSMMESVVKDGTARRARTLGRPLAGKTGTTNDAKDAWFAGYSTDLVAAVWVGYDDALPLGGGEAGGATALPAWVDFMKAAHGKRPVTEFPRPAGIVEAEVDPVTGLLARAEQADPLRELFLDGTAPTDVAPVLDAGSDAAAVESESLATGAAPSGPSEPALPDGGAVLAAGGDGGFLVEPPPF
jgi:penicillin-binding protein 1A